LGGNRRHGPRSRNGALATAAAAFALALSLAACGDDDSSGSDATPDETAAPYPVKVVAAEFPTRQRLGETTLLRLGVRNAGERVLPGLTVTISIAGKEGEGSALPFAVRDPQPGLAQPDRPVWILSENYPRRVGSSESAGAETTNDKTFDFGPLKAGATAEATWQVTAVRTGSYRLAYKVGAGLGGEAKAEAAGGTEAGGSFAVRIVDVPPDTVVTDSGEVVPAPRPSTQANR
jgi:hypothetical protein